MASTTEERPGTAIEAAPVIVVDDTATLATIPTEEQFGNRDWLPGTFFPDTGNLDALVRTVIQKHKGTIGFLATFDFDVLWKKKGATSKGRPVFGTCEKISGKLRAYTKAHFLITISANHLRDQQFTTYQLEALIYHELLHASVSESMEPTTVSHDLEMFIEEVREYGLWRPDLKAAAPVMKQASLF